MEDTIVYTPNEIATMTIQYLQERVNNKAYAVDLGHKELDEIINPAHPGDLISILGRPGSGKTSFMIRWARYRAEQLAGRDDPDRTVVYITLEQSVEDLYAFVLSAETRISITDMAKGNITEEQMQNVLGVTVKLLSYPLCFLGHSATNRRARPNLYIDTIRKNLHTLEDRGTLNNGKPFKLDMIFMDYLQRAPYQGENKAIGLYDVMNGCKDLALEFACPFVLGVQARREVEARQSPSLPIPGLADAQWTSGVEQISDVVISTVRPSKYRKPGQEFGTVTVEGHAQMLVTLLKQKLGLDNKAVWVYFDPALNHLDRLEMQYYQEALDYD